MCLDNYLGALTGEGGVGGGGAKLYDSLILYNHSILYGAYEKFRLRQHQSGFLNIQFLQPIGEKNFVPPAAHVKWSLEMYCISVLSGLKLRDPVKNST